MYIYTQVDANDVCIAIKVLSATSEDADLTIASAIDANALRSKWGEILIGEGPDHYHGWITGTKYYIAGEDIGTEDTTFALNTYSVASIIEKTNKMLDVWRITGITPTSYSIVISSGDDGMIDWVLTANF